MSTNRKFQPRRSESRIRMAGIAVVVLALMQISVASHQFEHLAEDASNTCRVCAQQDRFDSAIGADIEPEIHYAIYSLPAKTYANSHSPVQLRAFDSRAPPLS